jgi:hypothetical protein
MFNKKNISLVIMALAMGIGIAWLVKRRSSQMPGLSAWQGVLTEKFGEIKAQQLVEQIIQHYAALLTERPLPSKISCRDWHSIRFSCENLVATVQPRWRRWTLPFDPGRWRKAACCLRH